MEPEFALIIQCILLFCFLLDMLFMAVDCRAHSWHWRCLVRTQCSQTSETTIL